MNLRRFFVGGWGLCLALLMVSSTNAQIKRPVDEDIPRDLLPKVKGFERTDLFNHYPPLLPDAATTFQPPARAQAVLGVAKTAYQKLKSANDQKPGTISAENLRWASLEWFKAQVGVSRSRSEYIQAAAEYLEREGIPVGRLPDEK